MKFRLGISETDREPMPALTVLELTLKAVEAQDGLIHMQQINRDADGTPVGYCAMGAFAAANPNNCVNSTLVFQIQEQNDSYPHATPRQRRQYMIAWLNKRILQERSNPSRLLPT